MLDDMMAYDNMEKVAGMKSKLPGFHCDDCL
jgi:hypothetical protein